LFVGRFNVNALDKWQRAAALRIGVAYSDERDGMLDKVFVERKQVVAINGDFAIGENESQARGRNKLHHIQA
jgi:hypothetical protein